MSQVPTLDPSPNNISTEDALNNVLDESESEDTNTSESETEEGAEESTDDESDEEDSEEEVEEEEKEEKEEEGEEKSEDKEDHILLRGGKFLDTDKLNKAYPGILRKFPEIRAAIYRDRDYGRIFPEIEDAKEAAGKAQILDDLENDIIAGNAKPFIQALDEKSLEKFADDFLPKLFEGNKRVFRKITDPVIHATLKGALSAAQSSGNENLAKSVRHILNYMHGKPEFPVEQQVQEDPEVAKLKSELSQQAEARFNSVRSKVISDGYTKVQADILKGLDPAKLMSDIEKRAIVRDIMEELDRDLANDANHIALMNNFWTKARKSGGITQEMGERIISAYSQAALNRLPALKNRYREQLYKTKGKLVNKEKSDNPVKKVVGSNKPSGNIPSNGKVSSKDVDWSKTSTQDYLEGRITLRKR